MDERMKNGGETKTASQDLVLPLSLVHSFVISLPFSATIQRELLSILRGG